MPEIESVLVNRTDVEATGAGETAITIVAAAIGNAIFDATGARIREVAVHARAGQGRARRQGHARLNALGPAACARISDAPLCKSCLASE